VVFEGPGLDGNYQIFPPVPFTSSSAIVVRQGAWDVQLEDSVHICPSSKKQWRQVTSKKEKREMGRRARYSKKKIDQEKFVGAGADMHLYARGLGQGRTTTVRGVEYSKLLSGGHRPGERYMKSPSAIPRCGAQSRGVKQDMGKPG